MHKAMECPLEHDLRAFLALLQSRGIAARVTEESNHQALWVHSAEEAAWVGSAWQAYQAGELVLPAPVFPQHVRQPARPAVSLKQYPFTMAVLALCLAVFVMSWLLQDLRWFAALSFEPLLMSGGKIIGVQGFISGWQAGEFWRALTPVFLHFGILHLVFNSLWWWELGRRIEVRRGSGALVWLLVFSGVFSNACQYLAGRWLDEPGLFGGLSGVIYALIGYIGVWNVLRPSFRYDVPRGLIPIMLGFLLVCMTGVMEWVGVGRVANAAHVGGLVAGSAWALLAVLWSGKRNGY